MTTIRPATPADAAEAARVMRASVRQLCTANHGNDPKAIAAWCANKSAATFRTWLADPGTRVVVAERASHIVAVGACSTDGEILLAYVAPRARFHGVTTALLAHLETEISASGLAEARLESTETAHGFYLARGWQDLTEPGDSTTLAMRKSLAVR